MQADSTTRHAFVVATSRRPITWPMSAARMHSVPGGAGNHFLVDFLHVFAEPYASSDASFFIDSNIEVFSEQCTYQAAAVRVAAGPGHGSFCAIETSQSGIHGYHAG